MLKKFFIAVIFGLAIVFAGGAQNEVFAIQLAYIDDVPGTDLRCYVITDSIRNHYDGDILILEATFKNVDTAGNEYYADYTFGAPHGGIEHVKYQNSNGESGFVSSSETPLEWSMFMYLIRNR